jgi:hypothetical protein
MKKQAFPPGWTESRVKRVIDHYESRTEAETVAEDEAPSRSKRGAVMEIPAKLVPKVRALLALEGEPSRRQC